jgi:hypothetical protein
MRFQSELVIKALSSNALAATLGLLLGVLAIAITIFIFR